MRRTLFIIFILVLSLAVSAQSTILADHIKTVKLHKFGDQTSLPIMQLGAFNALELHFDDLNTRIRNYYYTFELCNADWTPSLLRPYEYIKGFQNMRITTYRNSSLATTNYVHYQATFPERNCYPSRSGNYLLKVYLDNDTSKVVFTRKMMVLENLTAVSMQIQQPFNTTVYRTGQKLNIVVKTDSRIQVMSPNDLKLVALQNNNWESSLYVDQPTIFRGNYYEYSDEALMVMPGGKEFRWIDLRSLRLLSDRMLAIDNKHDTTQIWVKPDAPRTTQVYIFYRDLNGGYTVETMESVNPLWQGDYAQVRFSYFPPNNKELPGSDLYIFGEFTNYAADTSGKMQFNPDRGAYEKTLLLKQGYYNYNYITHPHDRPGGFPDFSFAEGNYYGTENSYTVLIYYRPFGARADQLVGYAQLNSLFQQ